MLFHFRVRSLKAIRNLDLLFTIVIGYIGMMSEKADEDITMQVIVLSRRTFGIPKFSFFAIADDLFTVFAKADRGIVDMFHIKPNSFQTSMFPNSGFAWSPL